MHKSLIEPIPRTNTFNDKRKQSKEHPVKQREAIQCSVQSFKNRFKSKLHKRVCQYKCEKSYITYKAYLWYALLTSLRWLLKRTVDMKKTTSLKPRPS